jgi:hypothetical protein
MSPITDGYESCCYDASIAIRITAERLVELQRATDADSTYIPG